MSEPLQNLIWQHGDSRVDFRLADAPVVLGTGSAADIRVPGPGGQTLAQIDLLQGQAFLQPLLRPSPIEMDGASLAGNALLKDGDEFSVFGLEFSISIDDGDLLLTQDSRRGEFATQPPDIPAASNEDRLIAADWQPDKPATPERKPKRTLAVLSGTALALLVGTIWWLTTSVAVKIETIPAQPDTIQVAGPGFTIPVAGRWLMRKGVHRIRLQAQGYADLERVIDIDGSQQTIVLQQQPLPGELLVTANQAGAIVLLTDSGGSQYEQSLPARFEGLLPGPYDLTVRAASYLDWRDQITVVGRQTQQRLSVELIPAYGRVSVATEPAGANVFLSANEQLLSSGTPAVVQLPEGRHEVLYQLDGFKPEKRTYVVYPNTRVTARPVKLEPADAVLSVQTVPAGASITLDGAYRGRSPAKLALEPDVAYQLRVTRPGYAAVSRSVRLAAASNESVRIDLNAKLGDITIRTVPVDAEVFVNGRLRGSGTVALQLPAAPQTISVRRKGYAEYQTKVTPRPGFSQTIDARLKTLAQAAVADIPQEITAANEHAMKYFRGGTFVRGSSRREPDRRSNEFLRDARITRAFYAATREVSNQQFAAFRRNHNSRADVYPSLAGNNNPVVNVTWQDAAAYCNWLSGLEGREPAYVESFGQLVAAEDRTNGYRLPTEAEWIWMARYEGKTGKPARFAWGDALPSKEKVANLADESGGALVGNIVDNYRDGFPASAPIGSFD
ncbi:MAG: PEGA domain-containing protein, partial [Woeseiaceae bacterium]